METKKSVFTSRTIWTFFILFVVAILNQFDITGLELSPDANWVAIVMSVIGMGWRLVTGKEITWGK